MPLGMNSSAMILSGDSLAISSEGCMGVAAEIRPSRERVEYPTARTGDRPLRFLDIFHSASGRLPDQLRIVA